MRTCAECGTEFRRNPSYSAAQWARARFCGNPCSARAKGRRLRGTHPRLIHPRPRIALAERFWRYVGKSGGCWLWTGGIGPDGYGRIALGGRGGRMGAAHRVVLGLVGIEIPIGYEVDHLCRNRACVNPAHLEPVTPQENRRRAATWLAARRTHCKRGHPYDVPASPGSMRQCMTCKRASYRAAA